MSAGEFCENSQVATLQTCPIQFPAISFSLQLKQKGWLRIMTDFAAIDFLCWRQHKKSYVGATVMLG